ncbi:MAG: DUF5916 domain-containing protein [Acidobacteria bacterium]|nr:DUF5916 domain-containing protein [Acidobacteriota bacterium]
MLRTTARRVCALATIPLLGFVLNASGQGVGGTGDEATTLSVGAFENLTGDPADAWIGLGIAESVAADLGGTTGDPRGGISWRVEGAYQRVAEQLRITARLVSVPSGQVAGSMLLDGAISDLFALQDELARQLAAALPPTQAESEPPRPPDSGTRPVAGTTAASLAVASLSPTSGPPPPIPPAVIARDELGRVTLRAIRIDTPLQLDGQLDEAVYQEVPPLGDFIQQEPDEGAPATDRTEVWMTFDGENLYISARCWSTQPDRLVANEMKRDSFGMFGNESFAVVLDTFYDRRNGLSFLTNPLGGLFDQSFTDERNSNLDWNTVWDVKTSRFEQGWTLEMEIPFKSLRYASGQQQIWGVNFQRRAASKNEISFLAPIPAADAYQGLFKVSAAATMVGLEVPQAGSRLEIKPYGITDLSTNRSATPPVVDQAGGDVGFDVKYGLTDALTADFTVNTDFAQVEVDQQQVNLTRFSLFFPEKREFFLEGQGIFDFGGGETGNATEFYFRGVQRGGQNAPVLFFSRRIGLEGGRAVPITAGGRLTGKAGPYSIGLLNVQTGDEVDAGSVQTNFSVLRVKRDILRRSTVGAIFTGRSDLPGDRGSNLAYGVDGLFSFYDNLDVQTYLSKTQTTGVSGDDLSYRARVDYNGDRWGVAADHLAVGDNFRPEIGFLRRDDFRRNFASARFSPRPQSIESVRKVALEGSIDYTTDGAGLLETRVQQGLFWTEFENGDRIFAGVTDTYERLEEPFGIAPRVSIPVGEYSFVNTRVVYALASHRPLSGGLTFDRGGFWGGDRTSLGWFNGRIGVTSQLSVEPSLSFNWINLPQGDFTTELASVRTTYTMTPRMFVAALVQYNSGLNALGTNLRFRWEYQPGSELFVVYTDERDTLDPRSIMLQNRAIVVKATRLFRF